MPEIRLNKKTKTIKVVNRKNNIKIFRTGKPGPVGPSSEEAADKNFVQAFTSSAEIIVLHNLNKYPAISIIDTADDEVYGGVQYDNMNQITVRFSSPFSGKIVCN